MSTRIRLLTLVALCAFWRVMLSPPMSAVPIDDHVQQPQPATPTATTAERPPLNNAEIMRLVDANLSSRNIILKINSAAKVNFDVSTESLIELKQHGVPNDVIEAMQGRVAGTPAPAQETPKNPQARSQNSRQSVDSSQPLIYIGGPNKQLLPKHVLEIASTKAKGSDLASIAKDGAVDSVLTDAAATAAIHAAVATGALGSVPIIGSVVGLLPHLMPHKSTVLYVWSLPGKASATILSEAKPAFEVVFDNVVGLDPKEFTPVIVKLEQTANNWRIVGATKGTEDFLAPRNVWETYSQFKEEIVPTQVDQIKPGVAHIQSTSELIPGQYAVVIRPISPKTKFSGADIVERKNEGVVFVTAWDFQIGIEQTTELDPRK
jgi:hypothetical protein